MIAKPAKPARTHRHAALAALRHNGCTCQPEITVRNQHHLIARHANHCALIRSIDSAGPPRHRQLVIYRENPR